jgi:hypothetical protein
LFSDQNEPQRLALEAERYNSDLEALVLENYRLFVKNLTYSGQLPNEVRLIEFASFFCNALRAHLGNPPNFSIFALRL